ncbi:ataxin-1-like [Cimex lectularius]|uniref:AXH domain-containing protein n=1 Tax=Cimex lectularius TaxID=79782 RepID=A0A8I6THD5_CIMLE|nr:ataxin-1-like [Cimex lectularius]
MLVQDAMMRSGGGGVLEGSRGPISFPHHPIYPPGPEFLRPLPPRYRPPPLPPTRLKEDEDTTNFPYRVYPYPYPYPYLYPLVRPLDYPSYASPPQSPLVRKSRPKEKRALRRSRADPSAGFARGSLIRLASGELRRVEEMRTEDFISSADASPALRLDPSTVVRIDSSPEATSAVLTLSYGQDRTQVEVECSTEHPYFVYGQGWASCRPERTQAAYGLKVHQLQVGDVCISLTPRQGAQSGTSGDRKRRWSAPDEIPPPQHTILVND